ncbi:MAG TPA: hypothetical protein VNA25_04325 [Phycisphaerae bacterium]|nr:hypothetical protein [Phycisphaerae bacterium]
MKCDSCLMQPMRRKQSVVLCVGITLFMSRGASADAGLPAVCSDPDMHGAFIQGSLGMVQEGVSREAVLEELVCIATSDNRWTAAPALRALFHIANDDRQIREYLLRVIEDERATRVATAEASRLFVYVADKDGRSALLEHVQRQWDKHPRDCTWNTAWTPLVELGDVAFLRWLDRTGEGLGGDDVLRSVFGRAKTMIRLQENVTDLLAYLRSDREDIDCAWLVRQAMRHGARREDVRSAILEYLRRAGGRPSTCLSLVRACAEYGILTSEDASEDNTMRVLRQVRYSSDDEALWPNWATLPAAKRAEFYRLKR